MFALNWPKRVIGMLEVVEHGSADLIALGVRRPGSLPGAATPLPIAAAHKVVSHATCPALTACGWQAGAKWDIGK